MIAPLRPHPTPRRERRPTEGVRRARRWIVRTLLAESSEPRDSSAESQRSWFAALWIVGIAVAYLVYLVQSRF
jgi:hypothetical protein